MRDEPNPLDVSGDAQSRVPPRPRAEPSVDRRFQNLVEKAAGGILVHRRQRPLLVNAAWATLFGYRDDEVMQMESVAQLIAPQFQQQMLDCLAALTNGDSASTAFEYQGVGKNGAPVWCSATIGLVDWDGEPAILESTLDISARHQAEVELRAQNKSLEDSVRQRARALQAMTDGFRHNVEATRMIVETANEAFVTMDADGVITDWNPMAEITFGWPRHEAIGRKVVDTVIPPRYRDAHRAGMQRFLETGEGRVLNQRLELTALHREGNEFPIEFTVAPIIQDGAYIFHTFLHDISERKNAEHQLAKAAAGLALPPRDFDAAHETFRLDDFSLQDMNLCGAAIRDMNRDAAGKTEVAEKLVRFFYEHLLDDQGRPALALARCFETCRYDELSDELQAVAAASITNPAPDTRCMALTATAGELEAWNSTRHSVGHRVIPLPTEEAVEQLPMIAQLIRQLGIEVGRVLKPDADILLDSSTANVFHVAEAAGSPYIPSQDDFVIPHGIQSVVGFGDLLPNGNLFAVILFAKIPVSHETAALFSHLALSVRIALLPFVEAENRLETQLFAIDQLVKNYEAIVAQQESQLRAALQDVSRSNTQLERSNLDLQQFAYVASHDLQEPLRSVAGFCQLLQRRYEGRLDEQADEWIDYAVNGAARMRTLIEDLLAYSRVESQALPFKPTDLNAVYDDTLAMLRSSIEDSGAQVTRDPLPSVMGDRSQLVQVLQNLIGNSIKFQGEDPPQVHVAAERRESDWLITVKDNGIGIPADQWDQVFDVFRRLHSQQTYPGTGIGLAICRRVMHRHGGSIWIESEVGEGTTFFLTFPIAPAATGSP